MAAHPRSLGHCFNPISVFWCFDDQGAPGRRGRRGAQHLRRPARLPRPPRRAGPRPHRQGDVRLALPRRRRLVRRRRARSRPTASTSRSRCAATTTASAPFSASLTGTRSDVPVRRTLGADAARQRTHPRARHLAVGPPAAGPSPATDHPPTGGRPMTLEKNRPARDPHAGHARPRAAPHRPPHRGLGRRRAAPLPRRRRPPRRHGRGGADRPHASGGRTADAPAPTRGVLRPRGPRRPDRLRRGLPDRRVGRRRPGRLPHRAGGPDGDAGPGAAAAAPRPRHAPAAQPPAQHRGQQPGQHLAPLRPVQRALRALPRRDAELFVRALRHLLRPRREGPRLRR